MRTLTTYDLTYNELYENLEEISEDTYRVSSKFCDGLHESDYLVLPIFFAPEYKYVALAMPIVSKGASLLHVNCASSYYYISPDFIYRLYKIQGTCFLSDIVKAFNQSLKFESEEPVGCYMEGIPLPISVVRNLTFTSYGPFMYLHEMFEGDSFLEVVKQKLDEDLHEDEEYAKKQEEETMQWSHYL